MFTLNNYRAMEIEILFLEHRLFWKIIEEGNLPLKYFLNVFLFLFCEL